MHVPSYLYRSRHAVFYFRWPVPRPLNASGPPSTIKVSLGTRDPKVALECARVLCYLGQMAVCHQGGDIMQLGEMRAALRDMFATGLAAHKKRILAQGRLTADQIGRLGATRDFANQAVSGRYFPSEVVEVATLEEFVRARKLPVEVGTDAFDTLGVEYQRGLRDMIDGVLRFDASLESFDLDQQPVASPPTVRKPNKQHQETTLLALVARYKLERSKDTLSVRSVNEWDEHFNLLYEIVGGPSLAVEDFNETHAQAVKATVLKYPRNRQKIRSTRGLPLAAAMAAAGEETIARATINKYLQTYISLFDFAASHHFVAKNYFAGMLLPKRKSDKRSLRDAFTPDQLERIVHEATSGKSRLIKTDWQKWGILIAIYTGARLNEIAQLLTADIRKIDNVLCFSVTDLSGEDGELDEDKQLKSDAARRKVPVHPDLIKFGFLQYIERLQGINANRLFPMFKRAKNGLWGRKLGDWANLNFLKKLGYKSRRVVFHSFRHTFITRLGQLDVQEPIIKELVGHEQQGVLQTSYFGAGYTTAQLAAAVAKLEPTKPMRAPDLAPA